MDEHFVRLARTDDLKDVITAQKPAPTRRKHRIRMVWAGFFSELCGGDHPCNLGHVKVSAVEGEGSVPPPWGL